MHQTKKVTFYDVKLYFLYPLKIRFVHSKGLEIAFFNLKTNGVSIFWDNP